MAMQKNQKKEFIIGVADAFAFYNGQLLFSGVTNLTTSLEVSMEANDIRAGRGNKLVYSHKNSRTLNATIEAADFNLEFFALQTGNFITEAFRDVYETNVCVDIVEGIGTLETPPVEGTDVYCILPNGNKVVIKAKGNTIDLKDKNVTSGVVRATYLKNVSTRRITIDTETQPLIVELILKADKYDNDIGKVGSLQITIPRYQADGNFNFELSNDGTASSNLSGTALAVLNDKCSDGNEILGYVDEFDTKQEALAVNSIAALPSDLNLKKDDTVEIEVYGIKGAPYANILIDNSLCEFTSSEQDYVTAEGGVIKAVTAGTSLITVEYNGIKDYIQVTVTE